MSHDLNCPYCDAEIEICHDDGNGMDEDKTHQDECHECGKKFIFHTNISVDHYPDKAPCLNDEAPHEWRKVVSSWNPPGKVTYRCTVCSEEKTVSEEWIDGKWVLKPQEGGE